MELNINYKSKKPIYLQIVHSIKKEIKEGKIKEGEKLVSENTLCKDYYISRNTVRQALDILEKEGFIKKIKGKGSFVLSPKIYQNRTKLSRFYDDIKMSGLVPYSKILHSGKEIPDKNVKDKMKLNDDDFIYIINWVRYGNDEPLIYETIHLNYSLVSGIEKIDLNDDIKLYKILEKEFGIKPQNGQEQIYPCKLNAKEAKFLKMRQEDLGMRIERVLYKDKKIFEYTKSVIRGDRFIYTIDF